MEKKICNKCKEIIVGDIYQITITDYDVRNNNKVAGQKYEDYCQTCYEKLPVGVRPYDHKSGNCQSCGEAKDCGTKSCNNSSCIDRVSQICVSCWVKEWRKCVNCRQQKHLDERRVCGDCRGGGDKDIPTEDGLLGCNSCSRRVKTLFTPGR